MNLPSLSNKDNSSKIILQELLNNKSILNDLLPIITERAVYKRRDSIDTVIGKTAGDFREKIKNTTNILLEKVIPNIKITEFPTSKNEQEWIKNHQLAIYIETFLTTLVQKSFLEAGVNLPLYKQDLNSVIRQEFLLMASLPNPVSLERLDHKNKDIKFRKIRENIAEFEKLLHSSKSTQNKDRFHNNIMKTRKNIDNILNNLLKKMKLFFEIEQIIPNINEEDVITIIDKFIESIKKENISTNSVWDVLSLQTNLVKKVNEFYQKEISKISLNVSKEIFDEYLNFKNGDNLYNLQNAYRRIAEFYNKKDERIII